MNSSTEDNNPQQQGLPERYTDPRLAAHIYFLPNLMTAGNLFFGFTAIIFCVNALLAKHGIAIAGDIQSATDLYRLAIGCIIASVLCDALDGRFARMGGRESLFGKEFDSIADIVSFGLAPALMVFFEILADPNVQTPRVRTAAGVIAFIYLLCGAIRLARFNVITHPITVKEGKFATSDFLGLPVPAAAGAVCSLLVLINSNALSENALPWVRMALPYLLLGIAILMVSTIPFPSFKKSKPTGLRPLKLALALCIAALTLIYWQVGLPCIFFGYIAFSVIRAAKNLPKKNAN